MTKIRVSLTMSIKDLRAISYRRLRTHIRDALEAWGGVLPPDDPLFDGIEDVKAEKIEVLK